MAPLRGHKDSNHNQTGVSFCSYLLQVWPFLWQNVIVNIHFHSCSPVVPASDVLRILRVSGAESSGRQVIGSWKLWSFISQGGLMIGEVN